MDFCSENFNEMFHISVTGRWVMRIVFLLRIVHRMLPHFRTVIVRLTYYKRYAGPAVQSLTTRLRTVNGHLI